MPKLIQSLTLMISGCYESSAERLAVGSLWQSAAP